MTKKILSIAAAICIVVCFLSSIPVHVYASDNSGEEYITISVDAVDENGSLKYALDSDDPAAFGDSNEFVVQAGTSHTIYVKDAAGNITSQEYGSDIKDSAPSVPVNADNEQRIDINLEIGGSKTDETDRDSSGVIFSDAPAEPGSATVSSKTISDGSDSAQKIFYTFTTKEGEVLYLIIDQSQGSDNVYLLDTVSLGDLQALADGQISTYSPSTASEEKEDNLLSALKTENETIQTESTTSKSNSNLIFVLLFVIIAGGIYYYFKIYKNKKDEAMDIIDAKDMDEFEVEEEDSEDEVDFELEEENERYLSELLEEEDKQLYDIDPDEYAMSHMDDNEFDAGIEMADGEGEDIMNFATENADVEEDDENE